MLVVKVELHSARTRKVTELARMVIANDGTVVDPTRGDYLAATLRGRNGEALDRSQKSVVAHMLRDEWPATTANRTCEIKNYPRLGYHVWHLVRRCLDAMGYT